MIHLTDTIPRSYTAIAEWLACTLYILKLKPRISYRALALVSAAWLVFQILFMELTVSAPIFLWMPVMLAAVGSMFLYLRTACDLPNADLGYCIARCFVMAEFAASMEWQIYSFFVMKGLPNLQIFRILFCLLIYGVIFFLDYLIEIRKLPGNRGLGVRRAELVSTAVTATTIFLFSNLSFLNISTPFSGQNVQEIYYIRTLVDLCGVLLLFSQQDERQKRQLASERDSIDEMLHRQYIQYKMSRDNIETLNQKYHDLKHQIIAIREESDEGRREHYLKEMEDRIRTYESSLETGNPVLDILLSSKSEYCSMHEINFTCVADGNLLGFMDKVDICSVFGNALDNAIENVEKQKNPEKRLIRTAVYAKDQLVMIRFENYTEDQPDISEGLPQTTKSNKNYHGIGLKSIQSITAKYGGTMTVKVENNWFILRVLIPVQQKSDRKSTT